jgi:hypothetical protein
MNTPNKPGLPNEELNEGGISRPDSRELEDIRDGVQKLLLSEVTDSSSISVDWLVQNVPDRDDCMSVCVQAGIPAFAPLMGLAPGNRWNEILCFAKKIGLLEKVIYAAQKLAPEAKKASELPTVEKAYAEGRIQIIDDLLVRGGEKNISTYLEHFQRQQKLQGQGADGMIGLARTMRRLMEEGMNSDCLQKEPELYLALKAATSDAAQADIDALLKNRNAVRWWLHVLPFSMNELQMDRVLQIYRRNGDGADHAGHVLTTQMDLMPVWRKLGGSRKKWIQGLDDGYAEDANFADLVARLNAEATPDEQSDRGVLLETLGLEA